MHKSDDLVQEDSLLIPRVEDVRYVSEVERRKSKCTFCQMSMLFVRHVEELDIIQIPSKYNLSERILRIYWR